MEALRSQPDFQIYLNLEWAGELWGAKGMAQCCATAFGSQEETLKAISYNGHLKLPRRIGEPTDRTWDMLSLVDMSALCGQRVRISGLKSAPLLNGAEGVRVRCSRGPRRATRPGSGSPSTTRRRLSRRSLTACWCARGARTTVVRPWERSEEKSSDFPTPVCALRIAQVKQVNVALAVERPGDALFERAMRSCCKALEVRTKSKIRRRFARFTAKTV